MEFTIIGMQKCMANESCEFVSLSDSFLAFVGYTREEIREQFHNSFFEMLPPEDAKRVRRELAEQTARNNDRFSIDYRIRTKDGRTAWLHDQGSKVSEAGQEYYYCEITDATRYHALDGYYRNVLNSLPNPVFITNLDAKIVFLNRAAEKVCGKTTEEARGLPCSICGTPTCGTDDCCLKRYQRGEEAALQTAPDGRVFRVSFSMLRDAAGEPAGYISVSTDITELAVAEQQLRMSEERYRIAMAQTKNSIWEYDVKTKKLIQSAVQAREGIAGYLLNTELENVPESMIEKKIVFEESIPVLRRLYQSVDQGEKQCSALLRIHAVDGSPKWIHITFNTLFDQDGNPMRAIGVCQDVTAEKDLERRYLAEREYRRALAVDAIESYEVNLTRDRITRVEVFDDGFAGVRENNSYAGLVARRLELVVPAQKKQVENAISLNALLKAYRLGQQEIHCEYQRADATGQIIWVRYSGYLIQAADGDVCAFIFIKNVDQKKRGEIELQKKAERDALTGFYNRVTALSRINRQLEETGDGLCAMMMIDIDQFKQINDTYGHLYGDAVLSEMGQKLSALFRKEDILGRLGGDEFLVFLGDIPNEELATAKAEQVCAALHAVYAAGGRQCEVSGSVGIAFYPRHGRSFDGLYEKADAALYRAKHAGKNQIAVAVEGDSGGLLAPTTAIDSHIDKPVSENICEFVFKILCHSNDLELSLHSVLELLARHFEAQHSYIFTYEEFSRRYAMRYEWCADHVAAQRDRMRDLGPDELGDYRANFDGGRVFCLEDVAACPEPIRPVVEKVGAQAFLQAAIEVEGRMFGFLGIDIFDRPRRFTPEERDTLRTVGEIIGVFLSRMRQEQTQLEYIESLQRVLDQMDHVAYVVDPATFQVIFYNRQTAELFPQVRQGELCYRQFRGLDTPCVECPMRQLERGGGTIRTVEIYNQMRGTWVKSSASPIVWPTGATCCLLSCTAAGEPGPLTPRSDPETPTTACP